MQIEKKTTASGGAGPTPQHIAAEGEVKVRLALIRWVIAFVIILVVAGTAAWLADRTSAKDVWVIISPIVTASVSGLIGYISGERQGAARRRG